MDWSEGYITEEYTFGYFPELSPGILRLECLSAGLAPPSSKNLRYLELGYGQGVTINMHAAAVPGEFWGTDFIPTQAAFARALADASGSGAVLLDDSFAELAQRSDLPEFDIIALHGIWSWVTDENRRIIVDIIRRKLRVGGLVYISYNCLPGWGATAPLRHLIKLYGDLASSDVASMVDKLDAGMKFTQQVVDAGARYFRDTPSAVKKLKAMGPADRHYYSHEYFTSDWHLMTFSDMARVLDGAKLTFAASGTMLNHIDSLNLHDEGQKLLAVIKHPILRQSVRDYLVDEQFRRDIFVKGPRRLSGRERLEMLRAQMFVLIVHPDDIPKTVNWVLGEAVLQEALYRPVIEVLAEENYAPKTLGHLIDHAKLKSLQFSQLFEVLLVLVGAHYVRPAQEVANISRQRCTALNRYLCERARSDDDIGPLVSPVMGGGIQVERAEKLFLLAAQHGKETVSEKAVYVWELLSAQGDSVVKEGKMLQTPDENIAVLTQAATKFAEKRIPVLRALGIA
jgi:hypothetical protein